MTSTLSSFRPSRIITHSTQFHADDVFAVALLAHFFPDAELVRTLDPENHLHPDGDTIVADIGMRAHSMPVDRVVRLDHHQDENLPCAAVQVMEWLCLRFPESAEIIRTACASWLPGVDAEDRGLVKDGKPGFMPLSRVITTFLPQEENDMAWDAAFVDALAFAKAFVSRQMASAAEFLRLEREAQALIAESSGGVVVCERKNRAVLSILEKRAVSRDGFFFVVYPHTRGGFAVHGVCRSPSDMRPRHPIPQGVAGAHFVHKSGFLACFKDQGAAVAVAKDTAKAAVAALL